MAKNSRAHIGATLGLIMSLTLTSTALSSMAQADGLPLRARPAAPDAVLAGLTEGLGFKLSHLPGNQNPETWAAMVEETVLLARRLGCPADTRVGAERRDAKYVVGIEGTALISGDDPDRVLGRLLYTLAHDDTVPPAQRSSAAMAVLDQPLSASLARLASLSLP